MDHVLWRHSPISWTIWGHRIANYSCANDSIHPANLIIAIKVQWLHSVLYFYIRILAWFGSTVALIADLLYRNGNEFLHLKFSEATLLKKTIFCYYQKIQQFHSIWSNNTVAMVQTTASTLTEEAILSHQFDCSKIHSYALLSGYLSPAKWIYDVYDQEMEVTGYTLQIWRHSVHVTQYIVTLYSEN